jgi:hypothetical protein
VKTGRRSRRAQNYVSPLEEVHSRALKLGDFLKNAREAGRVTPSDRITGRLIAEKINDKCGWNLSGDAGVRELVNHARTIGLPIIGNAKGYCWGVNSAELTETIADLKSRIAKMSQALHGLEKSARKMEQEEMELFKERATNGKAANDCRPGRTGEEH